MHSNQQSSLAKSGDLAQLVSIRHKFFIIRLTEGDIFQTHRGIIKHDDLIGLPWGTEVTSHIGSKFQLMEPSLADLIIETNRTTQILYPKDIGFILVSMGIGPGKQVGEAGSGSGGLTTALAYAVGDQGHVYSYEVRREMHELSKKNLTKLGMQNRVTFRLADIENGFEEDGLDAFFLDVQNPHDYITQVRAALKPGGFFGCILPTTNQVSRLISALQKNNFSFIDVCETMLRYYRANPDRLRPVDRMVAHTGYLIFARPIITPQTKELDNA